MSTASAARAAPAASARPSPSSPSSDTKYLDAIEKLTGKKIEWHDGDLSTVVVSETEED